MAMSWGGNAKKYLAIFQDPDQDRIRNELRTFFGPRPEVFLSVYEKMREGSEKGRVFPLTWSWIVFVTVFPWFFYRKMYAAGAMLIVLPIVAGVLLGSTGSGGSMAGMAIARENRLLERFSPSGITVEVVDAAVEEAIRLKPSCNPRHLPIA